MKKILVIEDDVFLGDVLLQKLKNDSYEVALCRNGVEGLKKMSDWKPDLVLLDIILPSMNGYEILEAKVKDTTIQKIPVIVISNSGQPVEISRLLSLGVKDYLVKAQFEPDEVLSKVRAELGKDEGRTLSPENRATAEALLSGKKILWVEDDKFLSDIIARKLTHEKCVLVHAVEGEEALRLALSEQPDIILLDILLPGIDGFEILTRLKSDPKTKAIPVILLSNLGQKSDMEKGRDLGANRFLIKATVTLDEIVSEIKSVIFGK